MPAESRPHDEHTGRRIGAYDVLELLGRGGMGEVYRGWDTKLRREVALKALPTELLADDRARARFLRETRLACRVVHPYVATVFDVVEDEDRPWIVMERIEGRRLDHFLADDGPALAEIARLGLEVAEALQAIHGSGLVHRDLKPGNVMVTTAGHVKVMDFGVAYPLRVLEPPGGDTASGSAEPSLTGEGYGVGTVAYMSPEQVRGAEVDPRSDLFSLGILLYEAITGEHPFQRESIWATASAIVNDPPGTGPEPRTLTESGALRRVVFHLLEKDPASRYATSADVVADLQAALGGGPLPSRAGERPEIGRRVARMAAAAAVVAILLGAWWAFQPPPEGTPAARPLVAVLPFEDRSGSERGEIPGAALADLIGAGLSDSKRTRAVSFERVAAVIETLDRGVAPSVAAEALTRATGAKWVVGGTLYREGDTYRAAVELFGPGAEAQDRRFMASAAGLGALADLARLRVSRLIRPDLEGKADPGTANRASDPAVLLEAKARRALREYRYRDAIDLLEEAVSVDPQALSPRPRLALTLDIVGYSRRARETAAAMLRQAETPGGAPAARLALEIKASHAKVHDDLPALLEARAALAGLYGDEPEVVAAHADALWRSSKVEEALASIDIAIAIDPGDSRSLLQKARLLKDIRRLDDADAALQRAATLLQDPRATSGLAQVSLIRGELAYARRDYAAAAEAYRRSRDAFAEQRLDGKVGEAGRGLAMALLMSGKFEDAEIATRGALSASRSAGDFRSIVTTQTVVGAQFYQAGRLVPAETTLRAAIREARQLQNERLTVLPAVNLAGLLVEQGRTGEARALAHEAMDLARAQRRRPLEVQAMLTLADASFQEGDMTTAVDLCRQAQDLEANDKGVGSSGIVDIYVTDIAEAVGRIADGLAAIERSVKALRPSGNRVALALALVRRARMLGAACRWDDAARDLTEADAIHAELGGSMPEVAGRIALARGLVARMRGDVREAATWLENVERSPEAEPFAALRDPARVALADLALHAGNLARADSVCRQALDSGRALAHERAEARAVLAQVKSAAGAGGEAADLARAALDDGERMGLPLVEARAAGVLLGLGNRVLDADGIRRRGHEALRLYLDQAPPDRRSAIEARVDVREIAAAIGDPSKTVPTHP